MRTRCNTQVMIWFSGGKRTLLSLRRNMKEKFERRAGGLRLVKNGEEEKPS